MIRRALTLLACIGLAALTSSMPASTASTAPTGSAVTKAKQVERDHLRGGANDVVDKRTVTVHVSQTKDLRDRQEITVRWSGAHPTGGLVTDHNSAAAALQEYPVVVMQCRGIDLASVPTKKQVSPRTCWTLTPAERFAYSPTGFVYPSYRMDRYATTDQRATAVDQPDPLPAACPPVDVPHWVPFVAANGTVYSGGDLGCAGLAPEAANSADSLQPGNTTYGVADKRGKGATKFVIQNADTNASLGCSATVACTLEVIPIEGISCDSAGTASATGLGMPVADRPDPTLVSTIQDQCGATGKFAPGDYNLAGVMPDLAVSGSYWWTASNWRNRISVPLTFAPTASVCNIVNNAATAYIYGSETLLQATQQWSPYFCLNPKLFALRHVQTSEPQAKNLLNIGNVDGAIQATPPTSRFANPVVEAPAALSGFAIVFSIDGANGQPYGTLRLDARLLAKLLSESYRSCPDCFDFTSSDAKKSGFAKMATNPIDMSRDPEFQALNPGIAPTLYLQPAATLAAMSSDSDVMTALTSYINADPQARAWLNGKPDPWGMVVNPAYKNIALPVSTWPLLDTHLAQLSTGANRCLEANPVPWLPLVAAPVSNPAMVALDMQFDVANSQVNCANNGDIQTQKLTAIGRESPGIRFLIGVVSLADAERYQLPTAQLETHNSAGSGVFTSAAGRTFVGPTIAGLRSAAALLQPDRTSQTWMLPYQRLRTSTAGRSAYPGTLLISIDVPTKGLSKTDAKNYSTLLTFVAGPGQTPGLGNGQLPPGYLPLTSSNALGAQVAYTQRAAAAVAAQQGAIWPLAPTAPGSSPPPPSSPSPTPSKSSSSSSAPHHRPPPASGPGGVPPVGGGAPVPSSSKSASPSPTSTSTSPLPSPSASPTANSAAPQPQSVARTTGLESGPLGLALPVLALVALAALGTAGLLTGIRRR